MNRNNIRFVMKYGSTADVDKVLRTDVPHWDDIKQAPWATRHSLRRAITDAVKNPSLSEAATGKIMKFPYVSDMDRVTALHSLIQHQPNLGSHHIEEIAKHAGDNRTMDHDLIHHPNLTSTALDHMIRAKREFGDDVSHLEWKRGVLKKAGK